MKKEIFEYKNAEQLEINGEKPFSLINCPSDNFAYEVHVENGTIAAQKEMYDEMVPLMYRDRISKRVIDNYFISLTLMAVIDEM